MDLFAGFNLLWNALVFGTISLVWSQIYPWLLCVAGAVVISWFVLRRKRAG